ncbi:MAG: hypothetical protein NO117_06055 [Sulfolobales archaeon]|nr:hypothetical protein [Sulfolobales archaeon]
MGCPSEFYRWSKALGYNDCPVREEDGVIEIEGPELPICVGKGNNCVKVEGGLIVYKRFRAEARLSEWEVAGALYGLLKLGFVRPAVYLFHFLKEISGDDERLNLNVSFGSPYALVHVKYDGYEFKGVNSLVKPGVEALKAIGYPYAMVTPITASILKAGSEGRIRLTASGLYGDALIYKGVLVLFASTVGELERKVRRLTS